jgi:hypothetical protein
MRTDLHPRREPESVAVNAAVVSDATAMACLGLTPRQFRAFVREHQVPHARIGRRTCARMDHVLATIDRLSGAALPAWSEDEVIARAAGGRR